MELLQTRPFPKLCIAPIRGDFSITTREHGAEGQLPICALFRIKKNDLEHYHIPSGVDLIEAHFSLRGGAEHFLFNLEEVLVSADYPATHDIRFAIRRIAFMDKAFDISIVQFNVSLRDLKITLLFRRHCCTLFRFRLLCCWCSLPHIGLRCFRWRGGRRSPESPPA